MLPADFVEETMQVGFEPFDQIRREPSKPAPTPRTHTRNQSLYHSSVGSAGEEDGEALAAAAALASAEGEDGAGGKRVVDIVRALYDVDEQTEGDELTFKEGELIEVYQKFEDGWWFGAVGDREGYFPSNCVEVGVRVEGESSDEEDGGDNGADSVTAADAAAAADDGVAAGKVDIQIRPPGDGAGVMVGTAVSAANSPSDISGQIAIPIPPPKNQKGIHQSPMHGNHKNKNRIKTFGSGFVPEEDYSSHILILKALATFAMLFAFCLLAASIFGPFAATAEVTPYPLSAQQALLPVAPFLETAKGTISIAHGTYVGTTSTFKQVAGTPVNGSSVVGGAVGMSDFAAGGIVAFTHTLTGLVPFTQYGLRVEEESSCDTDYSDRAANEDSDPGIVSTLSGDVSQMRKERKPAEIVNAWIESDGFGVARGTSMGGCMCFSGLCVVVYVVVYVVDVVFVERYSHTRIV
jgi:hypothetical protein